MIPENIRALLYVLALAAPTFYLARRFTVSVISLREFSIWRNAWFLATIAAFLSGPMFAAYAFVVAMICVYAHATRTASVGLFIVLLYAVPLVDITIGGLGVINALFDINNARLLGILLLLPILVRKNGFKSQTNYSFRLPDWIVVGYVLLLCILEFRQSEITHILRVGTTNILDILIPYFAVSRTITNVPDLRKVFAALVVGVLPVALIGVIETLKAWHLYQSIVQDWGAQGLLGYIAREGWLRASASASGPITLGFIITVAIGSVLSLREVVSARVSWIALALLSVGLICTFSRGPWVAAGILVATFSTLRGNVVASAAKTGAVGAVLVMLLMLTPFGVRVIELLPFVGSVDAGTIDYRQRLFENSVKVIERSPWFGSTDYLLTPEMEEMRQGEGIIDIVNSYLRVTLHFGLVGLSFFLGFFGAILFGLRRAAVRGVRLGSCVRGAAATLIAILVAIATVSSRDYTPLVYWCFAGLCVAIIRIAQVKPAVESAPSRIGS